MYQFYYISSLAVIVKKYVKIKIVNKKINLITL